MGIKVNRIVANTVSLDFRGIGSFNSGSTITTILLIQNLDINKFKELVSTDLLGSRTIKYEDNILTITNNGEPFEATRIINFLKGARSNIEGGYDPTRRV